MEAAHEVSVGCRHHEGRWLRGGWGAVVVAVAWLAAIGGLEARGEEVRSILLETTMSSAPAVGVAPLYIHKPELKARVDALLARERELVEQEANLAGLLAGYGRPASSSQPQGPNDFDPYVLHALYQIGRGLNWAWNLLPSPYARYNAYLCLRRLNVEINRVSVERRALEKAYLEELGGTGPTNAAARAEVVFDLPAAEQGAIIRGIRERLDSLRVYRRETTEDFLLAQRRARDTGIPFADSEKIIEAWSVDNSLLEKRERELGEKKKRARQLRELIETNRSLLAGLPPDQTNRIHRIRADHASHTNELAQTKARIAVLENEIKEVQLGYDPAATGGKVVREESGSRVKTWANAMSTLYADLATRRRILQRSTREASHMYSVTGDLLTYREKTLRALQKAVALRIGSGGGTFDPVLLRGAMLDKGILTLTSGELKVEDNAVAESDYFYTAMEKIKNFGGKLESSSTGVNLERGVVDTLQISMELCSATVSGFSNVALDAFNALKSPVLDAVGLDYHIRGVLEKTYVNLRNKRIATDKKITFLADALDPDLSDAEVRARFALEPNPTPSAFAMFYTSTSHFFPDAEHTKPPLELFRLDSEFYRGMDGGLRQIALSSHSNITNLLAETYVIACDKAAYTLRDLSLTAMSRQGLDSNTGGTNWKLVFSPVKLVLQVWESVAIHRLGRERDYIQHNAKRAREHAAMLSLFPDLRDAGFDGVRVAAWARDARMLPKLQQHWSLLIESPEYRRFWFKAEKTHQEENAGKARERLGKCLEAYTPGDMTGGMNARLEDLANRIQAIGLLGPSEGFLGRAFFQDGVDKAYQFSFEETVEALLTANEMDPRVITMADIRRIEEGLFALQTRKATIDMVVSITDEIIWDYLTGKLTEGIMSFVDTKLGIPKPPGPLKEPGAWDLAKAAGAKVAETLHNKVNPFASSIPLGDLYTKGLVNFVGTQAAKLIPKFHKDALRDTLLVQGLGADPEWADKMFDFMWTLASQTAGKVVFDKLKLHETGVYRYASLWYLSLQLKELSLRMRGKAMTSSLASVLGDNDENSSSAMWRWLAKRRAMVVVQAMMVGAEIGNLQEALEKAAQDNPNAWDKVVVDLAKDMAKARLLAFHQSTPMDANLVVTVVAAMDYDNKQDGLLEKSRKVLQGKATPDEVEEVSARAAELFAVFGSVRLKALRQMLADQGEWTGDKLKMRQLVLGSIDAARRTIHLQSFNHLAELAASDTKEGQESRKRIIEEAARIWDADHDGKEKQNARRRPNFESMSPDEIKTLVGQIVAVVPTGSAGYIDAQGSEYHPVRSDLDYTVLLRDEAAMDPRQRLALECILRASFRRNSRGLNEKAFDVSYMVDSEGVFRQADPITENPHELLRQIQEAKPDELPKLKARLDKAYEDMRLDFNHPERYLTTGRKASLVFQASLGQDVLLFDPVTKSFQILKKAEILRDPSGKLAGMPPGVARLISSTGVSLQRWMALGSTVDDVAFLSIHNLEMLKNLKDQALDEHYYDALSRELSKRCIRVMLALHATDDRACLEMQRMAREASEGKVVDQGAICDLMVKRIDAEYDRSTPARKAELEKLRETVELWKKVKLGRADADEIVKMETNRDTLSPGCPNYRRALKSFCDRSLSAMETMAGQAITESVEPLRSVVAKRFEIRDRLSKLKDTDPLHAKTKLELEAVERLLDITLDPIAVRFGDLNGYQSTPPAAGQPSSVQQSVLDALKDIGCEADFKDRLDKARRARESTRLRPFHPVHRVEILVVLCPAPAAGWRESLEEAA